MKARCGCVHNLFFLFELRMYPYGDILILHLLCQHSADPRGRAV